MKNVFPLFIALLFTGAAKAQNVGIGTDDPMAKLEIRNKKGTVPTFMLADSFQNDAGRLRFRSLMTRYSNKWWGTDFKVGTDPKDYEFGIATDNTNVMKLYGTGNVTIGNILPQARLSVKAYPDFDVLNITGSADEPALKINAGRNIGIKNPAPTEALDITGNMRADTVKASVVKITPNAGTGKILTSDAAGNASWQNSTNTTTSAGSIGYGVWGDCATNGNIGDYYPVAMEDGNAGDRFGGDWSVSLDGDYAIIGAYWDDDAAGADQGSASIYHLVGGVWTFQTKLFNTNASAFDFFGQSVCIRGEYAIIGCGNDDDVAGANQGSASIYRRVAGVWTLQTKLFNTAAAPHDSFGVSVSIDGDYAIVGALLDDGAAGVDQGSATIYKRLGNSWQKYQQIFDPAANAGDLFGTTVATDAANKRFLIGVPGYNSYMGKAVFGKIN